MKKREFAIADIHGCCRTFRHLLEQIGFGKQDTLYLLGDYIDRGPDSRGVIETILELVREGYDIRPHMGNVVNDYVCVYQVHYRPFHSFRSFF